MAQEGDIAWHLPTTDVAREQQRQQQQQQQQQQRGASHQRRLGDIQALPGSFAELSDPISIVVTNRRAEEELPESLPLGSFQFAPRVIEHSREGNAQDGGGGGDADPEAGYDEYEDEEEEEAPRQLELPAGIHSGIHGTVPVDAYDLFWGGRGLGSGLEGSAEELETFTSVANSVLRRSMDPGRPPPPESTRSFYSNQSNDSEDLAAALLVPVGEGEERRGRSGRATPRSAPLTPDAPAPLLPGIRHPHAHGRGQGRVRSRSRPPVRWSDTGASGPTSEQLPPPWWVRPAAGVAVAAYLAAAVYHDARGATPLLAVTGVAVALWVGGLLWGRCAAVCGGLVVGGRWDGETGRLLKVAAALAVSIAALTSFVMLDILPNKQWERLVSLGGIGAFILVCLCLSESPKHIKWRPVFWGLLMQFSIAGLTLKLPAGAAAIEKFGEAVKEFLSFAEEGAEFVYGPNYQDHYFAMVVLSIIIFFGGFLGVCYHLGIIQLLINKMSYLMSVTFQVSGVDAVVSVGNMFVGMCESALLVKPFLHDLTKSELQTLMIAGMGSVSGGSLAAYISYGISVEQVLVACMLSAPASIMISKLLYPEREVSKAASVECPPGECTNVIEAAAQGAADCIPLVLNIGGIMIAFISLLALFDAFLGYFGAQVGLPQLSFNLICSYGMWPLAFLMGVPVRDCGTVASLLGTRAFVNEFVAYEALGAAMHAGTIDPRSAMLATYGLCGFSNLASIGVLLGGLSPLIPHRSKEIAGMCGRAIVGGTLTCCLTGCVAGFVIQSVDFPTPPPAAVATA